MILLFGLCVKKETRLFWRRVAGILIVSIYYHPPPCNAGIIITTTTIIIAASLLLVIFNLRLSTEDVSLYEYTTAGRINKELFCAIGPFLKYSPSAQNANDGPLASGTVFRFATILRRTCGSPLTIAK